MSSPMITKIIVCTSGDFINSVSFSYTNSDGEICSEGPWGKPGGDPHEIVIDDDDELSKISGTHDRNAITSLSLETAQGVKHGPFGKSESEGTQFSFSPDANLLIAFFGRVGMSKLNATSPEEIDTERLLDGSIGGRNETQTTTNYRSVAWGFFYGAPRKEQTPSHKIARIFIGSGDFIHSLSFSHSSDGEFSHPQGGLEGNLHEIRIEEDDDLSKISGTYGYYHGQFVFYSLLFNTENGQTYGPFGKPKEGEQFSWDTVEEMFEDWMFRIKTSEKATTPKNDYESDGSSTSNNETSEKATTPKSDYESDRSSTSKNETSEKATTPKNDYESDESSTSKNEVHSIEFDNIIDDSLTDEEQPEKNYGSQHISRSPSFESMGPAWGYFDGTLMKPRMPSDRITKIIVQSGDCIDSLQFEYTFNGETYTEGPWGGHGGDPREITIDDGDELIGISGRYGSYYGHRVIFSLAFHTKNHGRLASFGTFKGGSYDQDFSFFANEDRILSFWAWTVEYQGLIAGISVQTIYDSDQPQGVSELDDGFYEEKPRVKRITAQDSVNFAIRKLQDMDSSKAAALSGATRLRGVSSELQSIHDTLRKIYNVLMNLNTNWEDASGSDIRNCITELEDLSKHTERAIHMFLIEVATIIPFPLPGISGIINTKPVNIYALYKLSQESKKIKSKVDNINMKCLEENCNRAISIPAMQSDLSIDEIDLLGLKVDRKKIISKLTHGSRRKHLVVVAATAKGSAKTVLAEKIYQSTEVKDFFEVCFWLIPHIYLFKPFEVLKKMLLKLGVTNSLHTHGKVDDLVFKLNDCLKGKRCLVVIDDHWGKLCTILQKAAFLKEDRNSRMLITTEDDTYSDFYHLRSLEKQESLKLVQKLGKSTLKYEDYPPDFRGDESLPRSVFQNGDLQFDPFFCHKTLLTWAGENQLFPIIFRIYSELPSSLKVCFAYTTSAYPYGSVIHVDSLIRLWIVEEVVPQGDEREMKDVAECFLKQLEQRGLLRVIKTYYHNQVVQPDQPVRSVILHLNVHHKFNLAARKYTDSLNDSTASRKEILPFTVMFTQEAFDTSNRHGTSSNDNDPTRCHRLALQLHCKSNDFSSFDEGPEIQGCNYPNLQSLFFFGSVAPFACPQFTYLRVLSVFWANIRFPEQQDAPCWLDGLINLRYLGFIVCYVEAGSLGKSLCRLAKLETLDLSESIVSGLSEFIEKNTKVTVLGPVSEEYRKFWSPIPDMVQ